MTRNRFHLVLFNLAMFISATLSFGDLNAGELPSFYDPPDTVLHADNMTEYDGNDDVFNPTIIGTEHLPNPIAGAKYYLYYAPHNHIGVYMAYGYDLGGDWTEFGKIDDLDGYSAPDIRWIKSARKYFMWAHKTNDRTVLFKSTDGITFTKDDKVAITNNAIGTLNATYTRVYKYKIPSLENTDQEYIMLYSGKKDGVRHVWLAFANGYAKRWTQLTYPLVSPAEGEFDEIYGPSFMRHNDQNYVIYQDNSSLELNENGSCSIGCNSGGIIKYVKINDEFESVGTGGDRQVLLNPDEEDPWFKRYRGAVFYRPGDGHIYMFSGAGKKNQEFLVRSIASE